MQYIRSTKNESGAYPALQSTPFQDSLLISEDLVQILISYNGFVTLTESDNIVTEVTPNIEAWEAWKASLPPTPAPTPTTEEVTLDLLAEQEERLCMLELNA